MSEDREEKPGAVVLKLVDYLPEDTGIPVYSPEKPDLREIADRVDQSTGIKDKFVQMYLSFDDLVDCSISDRGFNLYTEDDEYFYSFSVVKKDKNK